MMRTFMNAAVALLVAAAPAAWAADIGSGDLSTTSPTLEFQGSTTAGFNVAGAFVENHCFTSTVECDSYTVNVIYPALAG